MFIIGLQFNTIDYIVSIFLCYGTLRSLPTIRHWYERVIFCVYWFDYNQNLKLIVPKKKDCGRRE